MRTIKIGRKTVEFYDAIDELPIRRYHKFNKYMLVDSGIGSDLNDINSHIAKVSRYISKKDEKNALAQLENLRTSLYMIAEETNVRHLSFAILVKSINGKEVTDLSDENIKRIADSFENEKKGFIDRVIDSIKKKIDMELVVYFPGQFEDAQVKEYHDRIRNRTLLILSEIKTNKKETDKINKIDDFLMGMVNPKSFSGKESVEILHDKQFEEACTFLESETGTRVDDLTTMQFFSKFEYIKKKHSKK
ncbi:hypothetical protein P2559Y_0014 [Croceibacter phage P2559Y]|uniref:virion structural protein n=1 Tax=Croceibacter phage P2559Y TaxID=1327037 RepID=UPI0003F4A9CA|nr:virion structural protein [Croceibacter phage P2559Y]AGM14077.1 hypothetical protein P2559Y_0014 [Croceibacter phage P2559Y]